MEFDDGDTGRIPLSHIRLLPPDYKIQCESYCSVSCTILPSPKGREFGATPLLDFGVNSQTFNHKGCTISYGYTNVGWGTTPWGKRPNPCWRVVRHKFPVSHLCCTCCFTAFEHLFDPFQVLSLPRPFWYPAPSAAAVNPAKMLEKENRGLHWGQRNPCQRAKGEGGSQASRRKLVGCHLWQPWS